MWPGFTRLLGKRWRRAIPMLPCEEVAENALAVFGDGMMTKDVILLQAADKTVDVKLKLALSGVAVQVDFLRGLVRNRNKAAEALAGRRASV